MENVLAFVLDDGRIFGELCCTSMITEFANRDEGIAKRRKYMCFGGDWRKEICAEW